ncbi:unnamed protein product [Lactuca virosa]|uniref:Uncharacterized protein n=1 Tax=Lactuca virosa TaxID=75947 RepID=A0AAU9M267_9ASTR|nr:unnamed protein product [Lactuca virosa]
MLDNELEEEKKIHKETQEKCKDILQELQRIQTETIPPPVAEMPKVTSNIVFDFCVAFENDARFSQSFRRALGQTSDWFSRIFNHTKTCLNILINMGRTKTSNCGHHASNTTNTYISHFSTSIG